MTMSNQSYDLDEVFGNASINGSADLQGSLGDNCTNDYCVSDEDYINLMTDYVYPSAYEWVLILLHTLVFVAGLLGNALVCSAVYRNPSMRTVTNYFIVNLAAADFLVILCCLPPTVVWDVTETWFLGTALCKILLYFQTVSVAVSVLTLTFISIDRWYAICFPLKFKSTTSRAKTAILVIWIVALLFDIPELVTLTTVPRQQNVETVLFTQCTASWEDSTERQYAATKIVLLYTCPLLFMSIAYCQIVRVLWTSRNIPGHKPAYGTGAPAYLHHQQMRGQRRPTGGPHTGTASLVNATTEAQLRSRRKAAKMLVAVVLMFAVCYFPVHFLSILRYTVDIPQNDTTAALSMMSHWLCYANSAVNPLIYNFMSGKYRKEFRRTFGSCCCLRMDTVGASGVGGLGAAGGSRARGANSATTGGPRTVYCPRRSTVVVLPVSTATTAFEIE